MRTLFKNLLASSATLALAIVPGALSAQEAQCTAEVNPAEIEAGQKAVQVTVALSAPAAASVELAAPAESGLSLAAPADIPRSEMAAEEEAPQPIELAAEGGNQVTLWLNTENAEPGTHEFTLEGGENACTGQITISGGM